MSLDVNNYLKSNYNIILTFWKLKIISNIIKYLISVQSFQSHNFFLPICSNQDWNSHTLWLTDTSLKSLWICKFPSTSSFFFFLQCICGRNRLFVLKFSYSLNFDDYISMVFNMFCFSCISWEVVVRATSSFRFRFDFLGKNTAEVVGLLYVPQWTRDVCLSVILAATSDHCLESWFH